MQVAAKPAAAVSKYPLYGSTELVRYIEAAMIDRQASVDLSYWATSDSDADFALVSDAAQEALAQNPYIFANGFGVASTMGATATQPQALTLQPQYIYDAGETSLRQAQTSAGVDVALAYLALDREPDAEKAALIHDYVAQMGTYDYAAAGAIGEGALPYESQQALGLLGPGTAVCSGYAHAFQAIATAAGLKSVTVTGDAWPDGFSARHAWNLVLIDGRWFAIDVTWDDSGDRVPTPSDYLLLVSGDPLLSTRAAGVEWMVDGNISSFGL